MFSNIYLNPLDQFIKRDLKEKYYIRYADDFVILSCDRDHLENLIPILRSFLTDDLKLELHPDKIILQKWSQGIDFLGYVIFPYHTVLRTKTKQRMMRKIRNNCYLLKEGRMSREAFNQALQSYIGILKHCRSHVLRDKIETIVKEV
ncbi:MAG: reverse transcriptase domain-containing protein [Patescibacteria group bacterium]